MVLEEFFKCFFQQRSMEDIDPWGAANFNPSGLIGRIYVGDHKIFLYAEYKLLPS